MKKLILEHLRRFNEGRLARHTTSNPGFNGKVFYYTPSEMRAEIALANELYRENDGELGSTGDGDGLYEFILYPAGGNKFAFGGKESSIGSKRAPGEYKDSQGGATRYLYIKANRGIVHPEYEGEAGPQKSKPHSPMSEAKIKVLFFLGKEIMDFIDGSVGYDDGMGSELQKQKMNMDKWGYKLDREKKEKQRAANKGITSIGPERAELQNQIQDVVVAKVEARKNRDKELVKKLTRIEKQLRAKMSEL